MTMPRKKVIAVYGSHDMLSFASAMGVEIAKELYILLTGGVGDGSLTTVKEQAINGAVNKRDSAYPAYWIGVDRSGNIGCMTSAYSCRIDTDLGHQRNYLEGCLCDAAVALYGGLGTTSEAVFALSLGRPVYFVGKEWDENYQLGSRNPDFAAMIRDAKVRVPSIDRFGNTVTWDTIAAQISSTCVWAHSAVDTAASNTILSWLDTQLKGNLPGAFPAFAGYNAVQKQYDQWIDNLP